MSRKNAADFIRELTAWIRVEDIFTEDFNPGADEFSLSRGLAAEFPCGCVERECLGWNSGEGPIDYRGWTGHRPMAPRGQGLLANFLALGSGDCRKSLIGVNGVGVSWTSIVL